MASASRTISTGAETPTTGTVPFRSGSDWRRYAYVPMQATAPSAATVAVAFTAIRRMPQSYRLPISDCRLQIGTLKPVLDRLYESFNYPDSAADPIQIVRR